MANKLDAGDKAGIVAGVALICFCLGAWAAIAYVAIHFITKFW